MQPFAYHIRHGKEGDYRDKANLDENLFLMKHEFQACFQLVFNRSGPLARLPGGKFYKHQRDYYRQKTQGIDIKGQEKNLQMAFTQKKGPDITTCELQEKLRNDMSFLEKEFSDLKNQFNKYLLNIV